MKELSKEQKEKCGEFLRNVVYKEYRNHEESEYNLVLNTWMHCLEANGLDSPNVVTIDLGTLDWPVWAKSITISFVNKDSKGDITWRGDVIKEYARPAPEWQPKDGEPVLFWNRGVSGLAEAGIYSADKILACDKTYVFLPNLAKPFDASKIGKPWSEI